MAHHERSHGDTIPTQYKFTDTSTHLTHSTWSEGIARPLKTKECFKNSFEIDIFKVRFIFLLANIPSFTCVRTMKKGKEKNDIDSWKGTNDVLLQSVIWQLDASG